MAAVAVSGLAGPAVAVAGLGEAAVPVPGVGVCAVPAGGAAPARDPSCSDCGCGWSSCSVCRWGCSCCCVCCFARRCRDFIFPLRVLEWCEGSCMKCLSFALFPGLLLLRAAFEILLLPGHAGEGSQSDCNLGCAFSRGPQHPRKLLFLVKNKRPKHSSAPGSRNKMNCIPGEARTGSTPYSIPIHIMPGPTLSTITLPVL